MGEVLSFCSVRVFVHQRGEEDHGHGHGHHKKDARRDTNNKPTVCYCELIAPLKRVLRGHLNLSVLTEENVSLP